MTEQHADVKMHKPAEVELAALQFAPYNPRRISKKQLDSLKAQLLHSGCVLNLVVQREADDGTAMVLIGGHQRTRALREIYQDQGRPPPNIGYAVILDVNDDAARELNIALNAISGDWDRVLLGSNLAGLGKLDRERIRRIGFSASEINALIRRSEGPKPDEDNAPDKPETPETKRGQLIELGRHRLLCGDATDPEDVARLLGGARPMVFTSPPYLAGREIESGAPSRYQSDDDNDGERWTALMRDFAQVWGQRSPLIFVNVQLLQTNKVRLLEWMHSQRDAIKDVIVWDKGHAAPAMSPGVLNSRFEFVIALSRDDPRRKFADAGFHGTVDNVVEVGKSTGLVGEQTHRATFRVELPLRFIRDFWQGDVADPFAGTGTTIIAAELLGRTCYAMDIDPAYCDVVIKRWEDFTKGSAIREAS